MGDKFKLLEDRSSGKTTRYLVMEAGSRLVGHHGIWRAQVLHRELWTFQRRGV